MGPSRKSELELGRISGVFGVRGEVRLYLHNRSSHLLDGAHSVLLVAPDGTRRDVVLRARPGAGKRVLGRIEGVADRESAAALQGHRLVIPADRLPDLEPDEFYVYTLEGARVEIEGKPVGTVRHIHTQGPVDLFEIDLGQGEPGFVPALTEFVADVDPEGGVLKLHPGALDR